MVYIVLYGSESDGKYSIKHVCLNTFSLPFPVAINVQLYQ